MNDDSVPHALCDLVGVKRTFEKVFGTLAHLRLGKGEVTQVRSGQVTRVKVSFTGSGWGLRVSRGSERCWMSQQLLARRQRTKSSLVAQSRISPSGCFHLWPPSPSCCCPMLSGSLETLLQVPQASNDYHMLSSFCLVSSSHFSPPVLSL